MLRKSGIKNGNINSLDAFKREDKLQLGSSSRKITDKHKALHWKRSKNYAKQQEEAKKNITKQVELITLEKELIWLRKATSH